MCLAPEAITEQAWQGAIAVGNAVFTSVAALAPRRLCVAWPDRLVTALLVTTHARRHA